MNAKVIVFIVNISYRKLIILGGPNEIIQSERGWS